MEPGGSEGGVDPQLFRPSADAYGTTVATVLQCAQCGHAAVASAPPEQDVATAYTDAKDLVSVREEPGQVATATRALVEIEKLVPPGLAVDVGCWTGSFLVAAQLRGWRTIGIEPSAWASARARERGLDVRTARLEEHGLAPGSARLVVLCDVLEHLADPGSAIDDAATILEPGGVLFLTVPNAGSGLARLLGRRWWSVLPMHLQYFTRESLTRLLTDHGFVQRSVATHPKAYSARYYAERLAGYSPTLGRAATKLLERLGQADRQVSPDLRDRLAVTATRQPGPEPTIRT